MMKRQKKYDNVWVEESERMMKIGTVRKCMLLVDRGVWYACMHDIFVLLI